VSQSRGKLHRRESRSIDESVRTDDSVEEVRSRTDQSGRRSTRVFPQNSNGQVVKDQTNVVVARRDLLAKRQGANQKFDDFLVDFLEKADDAEINTMTPDDWRTTLIVCALCNARP